MKLIDIQSELNDQFYQAILNTINKQQDKAVLYSFDNNQQIVLLVTNNNLFVFKENAGMFQKQKFPIKTIVNFKVLSYMPDGAVSFAVNDKHYVIKYVIKGRLFDFKQFLLKQPLSLANYDYTVRGNNNYLSNIDHAEEIDNLRLALQNGEISQYEYDDYNASISKAGK